MIVNLECVDCGFVFDTELGKLQMNKKGSLIYENKPICPRCKAYDRVYISDKGIKQLDQWFKEYLNQMNGSSNK